MTDLDIPTLEGIVARVHSHAQTTALFAQVRGHEPKNAPGNGLNVATWFDRIRPYPARSGLAVTSSVLVFMVRIYNPMTMEPQDRIDPTVVDATARLIKAYSGDFDLGGTITAVDLLGMAGAPLEARGGYLLQDGKPFRTVEITLPLLVDDLWPQTS